MIIVALVIIVGKINFYLTCKSGVTRICTDISMFAAMYFLLALLTYCLINACCCLLFTIQCP